MVICSLVSEQPNKPKRGLPLNGWQIAQKRILEDRRKHLQSLDKAIVAALSLALSGRMAVMGEMIKIKKELDRPIYDPACEKRKLRELKALAKKNNVPWELLHPIFLWLFQKAKEEQMKLLRQLHKNGERVTKKK